MKTVGISRIAAVSLAAWVLASGAMAGETIRLRRGLVVPVRFESALSLREGRVDDRFQATVEDSRDVPVGTRVLGRIVDIQPPRGEKAGFMDLEFDTLILPDGTRQRIQAVPIRMDDKSIRKGGDGRFTAKKKLEDTSKHVVGGMIGGYILGKILGDKGSEGIMLGALAGIILAESERNGSANNEIVIKRDAKMGALFERDAQFEWDERNENRDESAERAPTIAYEERELRFPPEQAPFRDGSTWMVPLERAAGQLGLTVDGSNSRRIFVEDDEMVMILEQESKNYRLNGKKGILPKNVVSRDGTIYIPLDALLAAKIGHWSINGTKI